MNCKRTNLTDCLLVFVLMILVHSAQAQVACVPKVDTLIVVGDVQSGLCAQSEVTVAAELASDSVSVSPSIYRWSIRHFTALDTFVSIPDSMVAFYLPASGGYRICLDSVYVEDCDTNFAIGLCRNIEVLNNQLDVEQGIAPIEKTGDLICQNDQLLANVNADLASRYFEQWSSSLGSIPDSLATRDSVVVDYSRSGVDILRLILTDSVCVTDTFYAETIVRPSAIPVDSMTSPVIRLSNEQICIGDQVWASNELQLDSSYCVSWESTHGFIVDTLADGDSILISYPTVGFDTISMIVSDSFCVLDTFIAEVKILADNLPINDTVEVVEVASDSICVGSTLPLTIASIVDTAYSNVWSSSIGDLVLTDSTVLVSYLRSGIDTVSLILSDDICRVDTFYRYITVLTDDLGFLDTLKVIQVDTNRICVDQILQVHVDSLLDTTFILQWKSSIGAVVGDNASDSIMILYNQAGLDTIELIISDQLCAVDTFTYVVEVVTLLDTPRIVCLSDEDRLIFDWQLDSLLTLVEVDTLVNASVVGSRYVLDSLTAGDTVSATFTFASECQLIELEQTCVLQACADSLFAIVELGRVCLDPQLDTIGLNSVFDSIVITGASYYGQGVDTEQNTFLPSRAGVGLAEISVVYIDSVGCLFHDTMTTTVVPLVMPPDLQCLTFDSSLVFAWPIDPKYDAIEVGSVELGELRDTSFVLTSRLVGDSIYANVKFSTECGLIGADTTCVLLDCAPLDFKIESIPDICLTESEGPIELKVIVDTIPVIATWFGSGIADNSKNMFDPVLAGDGTHVLVARYIDTLGCVYQSLDTIEVREVVADFDLETSRICITDSLVVSFDFDSLQQLTWDFGLATAAFDSLGQSYRLEWDTFGIQQIDLFATEFDCPSPILSQEVLVDPLLLVPNIRYEIIDTNIVISWDTVIGAAGYTLIIDALLAIDDSLTNQYNLPITEQLQVHQVRLIVNSGTRCPSVSNERQIHYIASPEVFVSVTNPCNGNRDFDAFAFLPPSNVDVNWITPAGADTLYWFEVNIAVSTAAINSGEICTYYSLDTLSSDTICSSFVNCTEVQQQSQYDILRELYCDTDGNRWRINLGWSSLDELQIDCDYCSWYGVECDLDGMVIGLRLPANNITGLLPESLSQLSELRTIDLSSNALAYDLGELIAKWPELAYIDLSNNRLTGEIPTVLNDSLTLLDLSGNQLQGILPGELAELDSLVFLHLNDNLLSGCIPNNYKTLCEVDVDLANNPDLVSDSWIDFCATRVGACDPLGIGQVDLDIRVYPNPGVNTITVEGVTASTRYQIHSLLGRKITSGILDQSIDISSLNSGLYLLLLEDMGVVKFSKSKD